MTAAEQLCIHEPGMTAVVKVLLKFKNISMKNHPILKHMFEDEQLKRYENYSWGLSGKINGTISCLLKYYV